MLSELPEVNSPLGMLMQRILEESPELSFEQAREAARNQLHKCAGRKYYRVTTPKQDARSIASLKRAANATRETAISARSSAIPIAAEAQP